MDGTGTVFIIFFYLVQETGTDTDHQYHGWYWYCIYFMCFAGIRDSTVLKWMVLELYLFCFLLTH